MKPLTPAERFIPLFRSAAGGGGVVELKLRLLVDLVPELQKYAHAENLEDIEKKVAEYFGASLCEEDKQTLVLCRQLRNKLLHGNFSVAREKLEELGTNPGRGGVRKVSLEGLSPAERLERMRLAQAGVEGTFKFVAETQSTEPGGIYGWLLELGMAGDFQKAVEVFSRAEAIIDRLFKIAPA